MTDLARRSRAELVTLGREYMLFGHLLNRAALPHVHVRLGAEAREAVAIDEWMGASPVYTRRMQRTLRFAGTGVDTIFKGFQLDVGFPHQYMDVAYQLESERRGYFWLKSCGALLEVEKYGEGAVRSMCHAIEDPTFDASAVATNPRARCRPIHRPPRTPADRTPHCHWEVAIDETATPVVESDITRRVATSRLATHVFEGPHGTPGDGRDDYSGPFDPSFSLEHLSHAALVRACREFLVQSHLLIRALMLSVTDHSDLATAREVALAQWIGAGHVAATRLRGALGVGGDGTDAVAAVLAAHPAFVPGYQGISIGAAGADHLRVAFVDGAAFDEGDGLGWAALLDAAPNAALDAMVQAVNPRARAVPVPPGYDERLAFEIVIDRQAEPAPIPAAAAMVHATNTAAFSFTAPAAG